MSNTMGIFLDIIIAIASAVLAIFLTKWQIKKNILKHYFINSYDIGKGLTNDFPHFELHYENDIMQNNVRVLEGGFINLGRNDIGDNYKETYIQLILPEGCIVKAIKIKPLAKGLNVTYKIDETKENIITFIIDGILKSDECFDYTAIVETPTDVNNYDNNLKFHHRILNTKDIKNIYLGQNTYAAKKRKYYVSMPILLILSVLGMIMSSMYPELHFKMYKNDTNEQVNMYMSPSSDIYVNGHLPFPGISGNKITLEEIEKDYHTKPDTTLWSAYLVPLVMSIMIVILFIVTIINLIAERNVMKISNLHERAQKAISEETVK